MQNLSQMPRPLRYAVANTKFIRKFPKSSDELWEADIKICRPEEWCTLFEKVLFVESNDLSYIFGIEFENGFPLEFNRDIAKKQEEFINFLRTENQKDNDALGILAGLFRGYEYASLGHATAAYLSARKKIMNIGVSFRNAEGDFELLGINTTEEDYWLRSAG